MWVMTLKENLGSKNFTAKAQRSRRDAEMGRGWDFGGEKSKRGGAEDGEGRRGGGTLKWKNGRDGRNFLQDIFGGAGIRRNEEIYDFMRSGGGDGDVGGGAGDS